MLGAGAISTDTRVGGAGVMSAATSLTDWHRHPLALLLVLILLVIFVRKVLA